MLGWGRLGRFCAIPGAPMLSKEAYIQRLSQCLDAPGELAFLERLSVDELSLLWSKVASKALRLTRVAEPKSA